jgi:hypothetical protein
VAAWQVKEFKATDKKARLNAEAQPMMAPLSTGDTLDEAQ